MATASAIRIVRQSGLLYADPTSLIAAPFGGTCLGYVKDLECRFTPRTLENTAEEWGGRAVDVLELGEDLRMAGVLRGMDSDAIGKLFENTATGATSAGRTINIQAAGTIRAGAWGSDREFKLLFAPDDLSRGQFVVIYKAIPMLEAAAKLALNLANEIGVAFVFIGRPATETGSKMSVGQIGTREGIALTPA